MKHPCVQSSQLYNYILKVGNIFYPNTCTVKMDQITYTCVRRLRLKIP